jgi:hypothetical protein
MNSPSDLTAGSIWSFSEGFRQHQPSLHPVSKVYVYLQSIYLPLIFLDETARL